MNTRLSKHIRSLCLERAENLCEWKYLDGSLCTNGYGLDCHHTTYHYFRDNPDLLTVFCPAHHHIADTYRKSFLLTAPSLQRWYRDTLGKKLDNIPHENGLKFINRLKREHRRFSKEFKAGMDAFFFFSDNVLISIDPEDTMYMFTCEFDSAQRKRLTQAIWFIEKIRSFMYVPEIINRDIARELDYYGNAILGAIEGYAWDDSKLINLFNYE